MQLAVAARTREQIEQVAREIGGIAIEADVADATSVARMDLPPRAPRP
jgi:NADP-dependent 3-hydroxy acid dehydrogenase YdfG